MAKKLTAKARLIGRFPACKTSCSFNVECSDAHAIDLAHHFVRGFRTAMHEVYKDNRPELKKIIITITLP